jgi:hypothetical protein
MTIAEQFQARLAEEIETGEFNGFPLRLRRMRAKALFEQGVMPMFFADVYRQAQGVEPEDARNTDQERKLTAAEFDELEKFKNVLILDCCIEPKLKAMVDEPGDVLLDDLPDDVREFIYLYSQRLADFPNGTTAQKEEPFLRERKGTKKPAAADSRGSAVRKKTKPTARR